MSVSLHCFLFDVILNCGAYFKCFNLLCSISLGGIKVCLDFYKLKILLGKAIYYLHVLKDVLYVSYSASTYLRGFNCETGLKPFKHKHKPYFIISVDSSS